MSLENTDTNSNYEKEMIPDGDYRFKVISVQRVEKIDGMYEWEFSVSDGNDYSVNLFKNEMGPLLRVLGCNETDKGKFSWDTVDVEGKVFTATAYQRPDKKDPTIIRQKLKDFKAAVAIVPNAPGSDLPF